MKYELLDKTANDNGGILRTSDALSLNISKTYFLKYIENNNYERITRGIYISPDAWKDDLYLFQLRFPGIVYSHNVALFLLDMTDREPLKYTATVRQGYNATTPRESGIKIFTVKREWYELGIISATTTMGHQVNIYSPERTICDILRPNAKIELQDRQTALKEYVRRKDKDIPLLMKYANVFKIEKLLKQYLEVLL